MKSITLLLTYCICTLLSSAVFAQTWENVGTPGYSAYKVFETPVATDQYGTPYVVYADSAYGYRATVMKYSGGSWTPLGSPGFSAGEARIFSIAVDEMGYPYVAFADAAAGYRATVMKYNGSTWVNIGSAGFTSAAANKLSIVIDNSSGTPYISYTDEMLVPSNAHVMKYNGSNWITVGPAPFESGGSVEWMSMAISKSGTPYVAYEDGQDGPVTVRKYMGSWSVVGSPGFTLGKALHPSIALDTNETPYVVYTDDFYDGGATVQKFDGIQWVPVGGYDISSDIAFGCVIAIDKTIPYIAFSDYSQNQKATVMTFNGSVWSILGYAGLSDTIVTAPSMALDIDGLPFISYPDIAYGHKATLRKFGFPARSTTLPEPTQNLSIYPCPASGELILSITSAESTAIVDITDVLGNKIKELTVKTNTDVHVLLDVLPGIYFASAVIGHKPYIVKIVAQ